MRIFWTVPLCVLLLVAVRPAEALSPARLPPATDDPVKWTAARIVELRDSPSGEAQVRQQMEKFFQQADYDGGGISESDDSLRERTRVTSARAKMVAEWMKFDLNGDGAVSSEEIEEQKRRQVEWAMRVDGAELVDVERQVGHRMDTVVARKQEQDTNGDGLLAFEEMTAFAVRIYPPPTGPFPEGRRSVPSNLDGDGDGVITLQEFMAIVEQAIAFIDLDGNKTLSPTEMAAFRENHEEYFYRLSIP